MSRKSLGLLASAFVLLVLSMLLIFQFTFSQGGDGVHPRPLVELAIKCADGSWEKLNRSGVVGCRVEKNFKLIVRLVNLGEEPSVRGVDVAAGVLLVIDGGQVINYSLGGFDWAIGVAENLEITDVNGSRIIEIFSKSIGGRDLKEAYLEIEADDKTSSVKLSYRGWILDEDDKVVNPSGEEEPYCARYPPENPVDNPPDSRWSGGEFMKYKTFDAIVPVAR